MKIEVVDLREAHLVDVDLEGPNLRGSNLEVVDLREVHADLNNMEKGTRQ